MLDGQAKLVAKRVEIGCLRHCLVGEGGQGSKLASRDLREVRERKYELNLGDEQREFLDGKDRVAIGVCQAQEQWKPAGLAATPRMGGWQ